MRWLRSFLNGEDIIKEINTVTYEIYLIDYRLPCNKNGIDVAIEILNNFTSARILFITVYEHLHNEISKNPIFIDRNIQVLLKPIKLGKIECVIVSLVNKNYHYLLGQNCNHS
jgi:two-component SAPR family response regulator